MEALLQLFPNARFIYIHQNPIANIQTLMDGWRSSNFAPYIDFPNWKGQYAYIFTLSPGRRSLMSKSLAEICFAQYRHCHEQILNFGRPSFRAVQFCYQY